MKKPLFLCCSLIIINLSLMAAEGEGPAPSKTVATNQIAAAATEKVSATNQTFKVMSYNVHNFILMDRNHDGREDDPKPEAEKQALYTIIAEEAPDILALVEVGGRRFLGEIQDGLRSKGRDYPYSEWIEGSDHTRHVCLLSRFPIVERQPHTKLTYHLGKQEMGVSRGFIEADIQLSPSYRVKTYVAHLKSKRSPKMEVEGGADAMRIEEAKLLRQCINEDLSADPNVNLLTMGDFNDTPESPPLKAILADPVLKLFDLRPVDARGYDGTFYFSKKFERIDYLIVSEGLKHEYIEGSAKVRDDSLSWKASDHFSVQASFHLGDQ